VTDWCTGNVDFESGRVRTVTVKLSAGSERSAVRMWVPIVPEAWATEGSDTYSSKPPR